MPASTSYTKAAQPLTYEELQQDQNAAADDELSGDRVPWGAPHSISWKCRDGGVEFMARLSELPTVPGELAALTARWLRSETLWTLKRT
jgi:hypothetical protein